MWDNFFIQQRTLLVSYSVTSLDVNLDNNTKWDSYERKGEKVPLNFNFKLRWLTFLYTNVTSIYLMEVFVNFKVAYALKASITSNWPLKSRTI
jgi:hypothetical protein